VNALREERLDVVNNPTKISDLTILEKALQEASKEHLTSNSKAKPGWYKAHATVLEPLIRNRNTAQAAFNARPSDENKMKVTDSKENGEERSSRCDKSMDRVGCI
jgi:hypothetical protein